ncbi:MAG: outer membrane protein transport protein [Pseudomonadota bacterium]
MTNRFKRAALAGSAFTLILSGLSSDAEAAGFYVREQSTSALMSGFAGSASRGTDASHLFYNPATIIKNRKLDITSDYRVFLPDVKIRATAATTPLGMAAGGTPTTGNMADAAALAPSFFASYALTDSLSIGVGGSGPFAVDISTNQAWLGRFQVTKSRMTAFNFNPVGAYRLTDWLTVGAGLQVQYFDVNLQNGQIAPPIPGAGTGFLRGDDVNVGFTAGVLLEPTESTTIGIGYRSRIKHKLKGRSGIQGLPIPQVPSRFNITTPDILTASISHDVNESFSLHGTFEWANWSLFDAIVVQTPGLTTVRPQGWEDTYSGFGGATYKINDRTVVGAGLGYTTAVTDGGTSSISPDGDRLTIAAGISHRVMDSMTIKAGYEHVFFSDTNISIPPGPSGTMTGTSEIDIHTLSFSTTINW